MPKSSKNCQNQGINIQLSILSVLPFTVFAVDEHQQISHCSAKASSPLPYTKSFSNDKMWTEFAG